MDFNLDENCIVCHEDKFNPEDFEIVEVYRFEGNSDPGDEMIVFAISSDEHQAKGTVVNGFGVYADGSNSSLVRYLHSQL